MLRQLIDEHAITWPQVPAEQAWNSPPAPNDLRQLPFNVLFDRSGKVVDMDVRGLALDEAVERLMAEGNGADAPS